MIDFRYHEHQVVDDIPECTTIKEYKCRPVQKGYKTEQVGLVLRIMLVNFFKCYGKFRKEVTYIDYDANSFMSYLYRWDCALVTLTNNSEY